MEKGLKSSAWKTIYSMLCAGVFLLLTSCLFRSVEDAVKQDEHDGDIHVKVRWSNYSKPAGEWLVFYPEDRSLKPFSKEISDDCYIDDLPSGSYKLLLLCMDKADPKVQFCNMDEHGDVMIKLLEPEESGEICHPEIMFACTATCDYTENSGQLVMFSPYPLSLKACFEMPIAPGKRVKAAVAQLVGMVNSLKLFTMEMGYAPFEHYAELDVVYKEDRVCFEGKMLLPFGKKTRGTDDSNSGKTLLKMNFEYEDGETETLETDITQTLQEVADEAPAEVTFNLLKIGMTATVVSWVAGTGSGEVE